MVRVRACIGALATGILLASVGMASPHVAAAAAGAGGHAHVLGDFNGDGFPDVAVGDVGAGSSVGAVTVLYGSARGVSGARSQYWTLDRARLAGVAGTTGDRFGFSVTVGDFNGDGFADLAIGVLGRSAVVVLYGSSNGIRSAGSQILYGYGGLGGWALVAGDFNADGFADLAVGDPFAKARQGAAGSVEVHYGSATGFTTTALGSAAVFSEATPGMDGPGPRINDNFGLALASGDFNGDGFTDLAMGAPRGNGGSGSVVVIYGSAAGLTTASSQFMRTWGAGGGGALAAADFNGDGVADLAIGEPNTTTSIGSGTVEVHYGSSTGLRQLRFGAAQLLAQETVGMAGPPIAEDGHFGFALVTGDFDGDGFGDLAIDVPGESGATILYGSAAGLTLARGQFMPGIGPHAGSVLVPVGGSLAAADLTGSGYSDLIIGEPFTNTTQPEAGVAEVFDGSAAGLSPTQLGVAQVLSENSPAMAGPPAAPGDLFGFSMSAGG